MKIRFISLFAGTVVLTFMIVVCAEAAQQPGTGAAKPIPRTADGKPDLSGTWKTVSSKAGPMQLTAWGVDRYNYNKLPKGNGAHPEFDPVMHCYEPGLARIGPPLQVPDKSIRVWIDGESVPFPGGAAAMDAIEIAYAPKKIWIVYQYNHEIRLVYTDGRKHPQEYEDVENDLTTTWFNGFSTGSWEGDVFVIDTTNLHNVAWLDNLGHEFRKEHVVERFRRVDAETLEIERTITDPVGLAKPYVTHATLKLTPNLTFHANVLCEQYYFRDINYGFSGLMGINGHPWQTPVETPNPTWQDVEHSK